MRILKKFITGGVVAWLIMSLVLTLGHTQPFNPHHERETGYAHH